VAIAATPRQYQLGAFVSAQRRLVIGLSVLAVLLTIGFSQLIIRLEFLAVVPLIILLVLGAIFWQPKVGLYVSLGMTLLFEMVSPDPLMLPGRFFQYGLQATLGLNGVIVSPLEMLLLFSLLVWWLRGIVTRKLDYRAGALGWPVALFFLAILFGLVRGIVIGGGDAYIAFWEARSLVYFGVCYLLGANLVRTRGDLKGLLFVHLLAGGGFAILGAYRDLALVRTGLLGVPQEFVFSHEVVIFLSAVILQALIHRVVGAPIWVQLVAPLLGAVAFYTLLASQRRAGYIALFVGFALIALVWLFTNRKAVFLIVVPAALAIAVYLPVFWNASGLLGQPARAVRSISAPDERDASSNAYREMEKINVRETIRSDPFWGVGFGRPFTFYLPLPDLSFWPFWRYQPHHNVLWVWLKTGAVGFSFFWMMMMGGIALAAHRARRLTEPTQRAFALLALAILGVSLVYCYVDLGLTNNRVTMYLGTVLGVLSTVHLMRDDPERAGRRRPVSTGVRWNV
jgi:hypothetical protein